MERREFFQSLIAGGATARKNRKRTSHAGDIQLYHGPMTIPPHVYESVREDPTLCHTTGRPGHGRKGALVSRYAEADGTVWIFRCQIPAHRGMVGEIVQTPIGQRKRVHCWSAADPGNYRTPGELIERRAVASQPILPPLVSPNWKTEDEGGQAA